MPAAHSDSRLEMAVVFADSEAPFFPATEMVRQGPGTSRGWHSAPQCEYPQTVGVRFTAGEVRLSRLQLLANDARVPVRIDVHVALPEGPNLATQSASGSVISFHAAMFRNIGYFTLRNNSTGQYPSGELKVLRIGMDVIYVKLVFSAPHPNPINFANQIGVTSLVAFGNIRRVALPDSIAPLVVAASGEHLHDGNALLRFVQGGVSREVESDPHVLQKIEEFEEAKLRMIQMEDFESARRIRDQLAELFPLGVAISDHEHRKRKAIAVEDYSDAQKQKYILNRIRAYVDSLKPGMPYQRLDLATMIQSALPDEDTAAAKDHRGTTTVEVGRSSPQRSFIRKLTNFDEMPVGGGGGTQPDPSSSAQVASPSRIDHPEEQPLSLSELDERDRTLAQEIRGYLPSGSEALFPEHVADARASEINGWKKLLDVFGYYFCCSVFSRRFQFRESAWEFLRHVAHSGDAPDSIGKIAKKLSKRDSDVHLCCLYLIAASTTGVSDTIPSVLFPACDVCQIYFRGAEASPVRKVDAAIQKQLIRDTLGALIARLGDSNARVRQVVDDTVAVLSESPHVGCDRVCEVVLEQKPKFSKHAEELLKLLEQALMKSQPPGGPLPQVLSLGNVHRKLLKHMLTHASKGVRDRALGLLVAYLHRLGRHQTDVVSVLGTLKHAQLVAVNKLADESRQNENNVGEAQQPATASEPQLAGETTFRGRKSKGQVLSDSVPEEPQVQARRTLEHTAAMHPELQHVYEFKPTALKKRAAAAGPERRLSITLDTPEPVSLPSPIVAQSPSVSVALTQSRVSPAPSSSSPVVRMSSSLSNMSSPSRALDSSKQASPKRRQPPLPEPGRCQFCGEASDDFHNRDVLLEHFFHDCPMLCTCPLCRLPVEIREVHWHLAEDCQHKDLVKRCPRCYECVRTEEYDNHINQNTCIAVSAAQQVCPLCHEVLLSDDVFWDAHIMYPPFCPQNPRTVPHDDDDDNEGVAAGAEVPKDSADHSRSEPPAQPPFTHDAGDGTSSGATTQPSTPVRNCSPVQES